MISESAVMHNCFEPTKQIHVRSGSTASGPHHGGVIVHTVHECGLIHQLHQGCVVHIGHFLPPASTRQDDGHTAGPAHKCIACKHVVSNRASARFTETLSLLNLTSSQCE